MSAKLMSRRRALGILGGAAAAALALGRWSPRAAGSARLKVRPRRPSTTVDFGMQPLGLGSERDGLLYVPTGYRATTPAPLVLALHGATGHAEGPMRTLHDVSEEHGFLVLAVESRDTTWDAIRGEYGVDVEFIDRALAQTFSRCMVDPRRILIEGFSDGASYALGLGLANGDVFSRVVAFSPGFIPEVDSSPRGKPPVFISHGFRDPILPKAGTSDQLVPGLTRAGYAVSYFEFDGGHTVTPEALQAALKWAGFAA